MTEVTVKTFTLNEAHIILIAIAAFLFSYVHNHDMNVAKDFIVVATALALFIIAGAGLVVYTYSYEYRITAIAHSFLLMAATIIDAAAIVFSIIISPEYDAGMRNELFAVLLASVPYLYFVVMVLLLSGVGLTVVGIVKD
jgi:hypothetical protein